MNKTMILLGVLAILTTSFSGCISISTDEQNKELGITDFIFCSAINDQNDCTVRENKTFGLDDTLWLYFYVNNPADKKTGEKYSIDVVETKIEVKQKSDNNVVKSWFNTSLTKDFNTKPASIWIYNYFALSCKDFVPGTYILTIEIKDSVSGKTSQKNGEFIIWDSTIVENMNITELKFCSDVRGGRDYTLKNNATYSPNETVYAYYEITNMSYRITANGLYVHVGQTMDVRSKSNNSVIMTLGKEVYINTTANTRSYAWFEDEFVPYRDAGVYQPGEYTVTVYVKNYIDNTTITKSGDFTIA
ncbi:MAG: hypothetical protein WC974_03845 [Thermoplasmata archaeon]